MKSHASEPKIRNNSNLDGRDHPGLDGCDHPGLDGRDHPGLDGRQPSSEVDDLTLALSRLSTSTNSVPNHPNRPTTAVVTPATMNGGAALLGHQLNARTVPATIAVVSQGRRRYYVIVVGKCAGIYHDIW